MIDKFKQYILHPQKIIATLGTQNLLNWMKDETYLEYLFKARLDKELDLENPKTFNEKLQWLKIYNRNPKYTQLVDKYEVRNYIKEKIGEQYLIPLIENWKKSDEINFSSLPNQFVLKTTHDSGGIVICKDKRYLDIKSTKKKLDKSLKSNYYYQKREWPYKNVNPKIIAEEFMEELPGEPLKDFKIMCFNGEPKIIQVMSERSKDGFYINHYDTKWNELNIKRKNLKKNSKPITKPNKLDEMIEISRLLSDKIPFVRVDLYSINNKIYFGELTFYPVSGHVDFANEQDDYTLGSWITLPY